MNRAGPMLFCGDPHGVFRHIIRAVESTQPSAVILLGDMEPQRPLLIELAPLLERRMPVWYIHGNHNADSDDLWTRVWGSELDKQNVLAHVMGAKVVVHRHDHDRIDSSEKWAAQGSRSYEADAGQQR